MKTERDVIERLPPDEIVRPDAQPQLALLDVRHRRDGCRAGASFGALHEVWRHFLRDSGEPTSVACLRSFIRPCILTTAKTIPFGDAWLHEPASRSSRTVLRCDSTAGQATDKAPVRPGGGAGGHSLPIRSD